MHRPPRNLTGRAPVVRDEAGRLRQSNPFSSWLLPLRTPARLSPRTPQTLPNASAPLSASRALPSASERARRYEFAKRRLTQFRGAQRARLRRQEGTDEEDPRPLVFYGRGLVRLVPFVAVHGPPRRFPWPVPQPAHGNNFLIAVPPTDLQLEQGCLCLSSRCTTDRVACNPQNTRRFAALPHIRGRIVLHNADASPSTALGPLTVVSELSGPRRRITLYEYKDRQWEHAPPRP